MNKEYRQYYKSSSFKMASLFTMLLGLSAILLGYFLYNFTQENFIRETEAAIDIEMEHILSFSNNNDRNLIKKYIEKNTIENKHTVYFYQDKDNKVLSGNIEYIPKEIKTIKEGIISFETTLENQNKIVAAKIHTFKDGSKLLIARDINNIIDSHNKLKLYTILIIVFMLLVVVISFLISTFVVSRINKIAKTAQQIIETGDLSQRIAIDSSWDDLSNLSQILNSLLGQIESLMQGIKEVSDNIAHDLKTPLARLRNKLELLEKGKLPKDQQNNLVQDTDHILSIFNSLLRITNIEKGNRIKISKETDLNLIIQDVIDLYEPVAAEKNITIKTSLKPIKLINADKDLLFQSFINILDNSIKFSEEDTEIFISSNMERDKIKIIFADNGIGLSDEEKKRIFDRFYRADKSRNITGSGLGLSMVKAIIELHDAKISISDNNPGLKFTLSFAKKH